MPEYAGWLILAALAYYAATGIGHAVVKGAKAVGHGAKVVACAIHVKHCDKRLEDEIKATEQ